MYKVSAGENNYEISFSEGRLLINGKPFDGDLSRIDQRKFHLIRNGRSYRIEILERKDKQFTVRVNGSVVETDLKDKMDILLEKLGMDHLAEDAVNDINAPMPGLILDVHVTAGDEIKKGDPVLILEAMKMENVIKASGDGTVKEVTIKKGDSVEKNQVLVRF
ncbi:MAG: biotin/lipoyl-binding protein [Desulfobacterales bacterium]